MSNVPLALACICATAFLLACWGEWESTRKDTQMKDDPYLYQIKRGNTNYREHNFWEVEFYTNKHMTREQIGAYAVGLLGRLGIQATVDYDVSHGSELHHIAPVTSAGELNGDKWTFHCNVVAATQKNGE